MAENDETMKSAFLVCFLAAGVLFSGCALSRSGLVLNPVGPTPIQSAKARSATGTLVVYSAYEVNADFNSRDPYRPEYSDYRIFNTDGKLLQRVHNNSGTMLQDPVSVELPAGKYRVIARANGYGFVTVPVLIAPNQFTTLHLQGGGSWPEQSAFRQTNAVWLPDGWVIGRHAAR